MIPPKKENNFAHQIRTQEELSISRERQTREERLNPNQILTSTSRFSSQSVSNNSTAAKDYTWTWKYADYDTQSENIQLYPSIFKEIETPISHSTIRSEEGNLSVFSLPKDRIHMFSARIFKKAPDITNFTLNWSGDISIYIDKSLRESNYGEPYASKVLPLSFSTGYIDVDILLRTKADFQYFSINNRLGRLVDEWSLSTEIPPATPLNISVESKALSSKSDTNTNIIKWGDVSADSAAGYRIERIGPYNKDLSSPVISSSESSGYFVNGGVKVSTSGAFVPAVYSVSATDDAGESLPSSNFKLDYGDRISGVAISTGYSLTTPGAALVSGTPYQYAVLSDFPGGKRISIDSTSFWIFSNHNSVQLGWNQDPSATGYSVYRVGLNNSFRQDPTFEFSGVFGGPSGYQIAQLDSNVFSYLDTGVIGTFVPNITGTISDPKEYLHRASNEFLGTLVNNSRKVSWSSVSPTEGSEVTYNLYRTFYSGTYESRALVASTKDTFYIDSGISQSGVGDNQLLQGVPIKYKSIASVGVGVNKYEDVGLQNEGTFSYRVRSFNYNSNLSLPSETKEITAGTSSTTAPAVPSGIIVSQVSGMVDVYWENGVEADLQGTRVYISGQADTEYLFIGETETTGFRRWVGYDQAPHFALSNFNFSNKESQLSTGVQVASFGGPLFTAGGLDDLYVNKTGDIMSGNLVMSSGNLIQTNTINNTTSEDLTIENTSPAGLNLYAGGIVKIGGNSTTELDASNNFRPASSGTQDLGEPQLPWDNIYVKNVIGDNGNIQDQFVNTSGDLMTGNLTVPVLNFASLSGTAGTTRIIDQGSYTEIIDESEVYIHNASESAYIDIIDGMQIEAKDSIGILLSGILLINITPTLGGEISFEKRTIFKDDLTLQLSGIYNAGSADKPFNTVYADNIVSPSLSGAASDYYIHSYATGIQDVSVASTFQDITFDHNGQIDGWSHTEGSAEFSPHEQGIYMVSWSAVIEKTSPGLSHPEIIIDLNGAEVPGTQLSLEIAAKNQEMRASNSAVVNMAASGILKLRFGSDNVDTRLVPVGGISSSPVSASITMFKV